MTEKRELLRGQFVLVRLTEEHDAEQIVRWRSADGSVLPASAEIAARIRERFATGFD